MGSGPVGLWIDWDNDGFGTGAYDDCTSLVTRATYSRGSSPEITGAAQAGQAVFTVRNPAGLFNPDNAGGPLYGLLRDGAPVWWGMREDGTISGSSVATVRGRFAGRVVEVVPLPQAGAGSSTPLAQIICEDPLALYGRIPVALSDDCSPPIPCPDATPAMSFPALGSGTGDATGNLQYWKPGEAVIAAPTPFNNGGWNFPAYNYLGSGIDYAGNCVANHLIFVVVGDGTLVVPTVIGYNGGPDCLTAVLEYFDAGNNLIVVSKQYGVAGDTFTIPISTGGMAHCINRVDIREQTAEEQAITGCSITCGHTAFGYGGGATWTPVT